MSVRIDQDLVDLLGARARELGISRNRLIELALQSVVDPDALHGARDRRRSAELIARLMEDRSALRAVGDRG